MTSWPIFLSAKFGVNDVIYGQKRRKAQCDIMKNHLRLVPVPNLRCESNMWASVAFSGLLETADDKSDRPDGPTYRPQSLLRCALWSSCA
ncbi:hypothetical protein COLSTE_02242 [Collinsella stercoris DSM 13279]|uniref:Uncharacterized protein n=1 Tax=Collinsella stercoris DSM 13279 TaxID=445975 RepID=B6GDQ9_9ACTN|nr:hypothetical protein COLSTE_02242 [Collinsella stercoris DSM 13279]